MWICPKCGREFKRINQGHYCGKAPKTVLEYIDSQPIETHPPLNRTDDYITKQCSMCK